MIKNECFYFSFKIIIISIIFIPVSTITHELGHFFTGLKQGYNTHLHFQRVDWDASIQQQDLYEKIRIYDTQTLHKYSKSLSINLKKDYINYKWCVLSGTLVNVIIGSIGLFLLFFTSNKKKPINKNTKIFFIFLSLFWFRQIYILFIAPFFIGINSSSPYPIMMKFNLQN